MDLDSALEATHAHPPAEERTAILREQLAGFRRDFYGHVTNLQRIKAVQEQCDGHLPSDLQQHKEAAEAQLDVLEQAIQTTLAELRRLDPDAEGGVPPPPNRAARRA